ncbi:MAG: EamA family transporter [Thermodesulfobacteriota bacterium]|nr:EamA family transporter [Thermodesulfobacteriota bacterium]
MHWVYLVLFTALLQALKDVFIKRTVRRVHYIIVCWSYCVFALVFLAPAVAYVGIPEIKSGFWVALVMSGTFNTIAFLLYFKALQSSDLSLTIPMLTFTPLFMLITSPIIVGEFPSRMGLLGILLIVTGSYVLNVRRMQRGFFSPFKALFHHKGPKLMFLVALIWSLTANYDKIGLQNSSPVFWLFAAFLFIALALTPIVFIAVRVEFGQAVANAGNIACIGFLEAVSLIFQMVALTMTLVPYVVSIKRTSVIFGVILGSLIFKEKGFKERLVGAALMVCGVFCIALF